MGELNSETIKSFHRTDIYHEYDPALRLRRSGVKYVCTELESIEKLLLLREDIHSMIGGRNAFVTDIVWQSLNTPKKIELRVAAEGMAGLIVRLLTAHASLPYHLQPGVKEVRRNGYSLENGFELIMI